MKSKGKPAGGRGVQPARQSSRFDEAIDHAAESDGREERGTKPLPENALERLRDELNESGRGQHGLIECEIAGERLVVLLNGHGLGQWMREGDELKLYRSGSLRLEGEARSVGEAVRETARLVAAAGQA